MITVAAAGDVHVGQEMRGRYRPRLGGLAGDADVLLLAGDLTQHGTVEEAQVVAASSATCPSRGRGARQPRLPLRCRRGDHRLLRDSGMTVLEGTGRSGLPAGRLGVAGGKGFGGGFPGRCASEFGEPEMKDFVRHSRASPDGSARALAEPGHRLRRPHPLRAVRGTLAGEPLEIYPFLGSYLLAEAMDAAGSTSRSTATRTRGRRWG